MSIAANDAGTDLKGEIALNQRNLIASLNKVGLFGVIIFAPMSFLFTCVWIGMADDIIDLHWGGFGIHVLLASGAFLLLGPMASIVYRLLVDTFDVDRKTAKTVHGFLQLVTTIIGIIAIQAVWEAHDNSSWTYTETESYYIYHFRSSHSILGIFAFAIYVAQLFAAAYIYILGSKQLRMAYAQLHMAVGQGLVVVMLFVAALGMLYFERETYSLDWDDWGENGYYRPYMTIAQYCIVFSMFSIILVFYAKILM
jgi:hypothetical protein